MSYTISSSGGTGAITETITPALPVAMPNLADALTISVTSPAGNLLAGDILLANTMPEAEYMYGCTPTAVGMILGYYDLYGYRGADFSDLIDGDVDLKSRGTDGNAYDMDAFDTVLGRAIATEDYVYRFFSRGDLDVITGNKAGSYWTTSVEEELEYSFANGGEGPEMRTDVWNCIADYLGTGQIWRGNDNLSTSISQSTLEDILNYNMNINYVINGIQRLVDWRFTSMLYGLHLYVENKGYSLDRKISGTYVVDAAGGDFTFEDYKAEIDAGRPVLISIEGHSMVGYGYNPETNEIIFDDCYNADQRMAWDGKYYYSDMYLPLQSITVIGLMADGGADIAVTPLSVDSAEIFFTANAVPFTSGDYCYPGDTVGVNFTVSNLGTTASGAFEVTVYVDGKLLKSVAVLSLEGNSSEEHTDIRLDSLAPGLHTVRVVADEANEIQEASGANNVLEQKLMILKDGANIVTGIKAVNAGQFSKDDYVASGWQMHVLDGATASGTVVRGIVTDVTNGVISYLPGLTVVSQGGLIQDAEVYEYGQIQLAGTAEDLHVFENGTAVIQPGGKLTGKLTVENGGGVSMDEGTVLDFDLTRTEAGANALVNDLSRVQGTPLYTLTVGGTEAAGTYALAGGAAGFTGTISVVNPTGESLGSLTVGGEKVFVGGTGYTLTLTDSTLSVTVGTADNPAPLSPTNLAGTADKVSWDAAGAALYIVEYSTDDFEHVISVVTTGNAVDTPDLPTGTYRWRVKADGNSEWAVGEAIMVEPEAGAAKVVQSNADSSEDLFFAAPSGVWENYYYAFNVGSVNDWTGTDEAVSANGKGRIRNLFFGSADPNVLCLSDGENGDAIFVDDVYTDLPDSVAEHTARLYRIQEIRAGAGDDIVDMTSQRFEYIGDGLTIRGGEGNDTIWASKGDNVLFGDAGNDRIVGASGSDVIAGGIGDDSMHGGGGDDVFAFCGNWGADTVQQLETGSVTLWFASGAESNWNAETLTYTDGENSVTVSGVTADRITLKFGDDGSDQLASLSGIGAFDAFTSRKVFEEAGTGLLA